MHRLILLFQGPLTLHICLTHLFLPLKKKNLSVLSAAKVSLLTCVELVLRLKYALLVGFVLSMQTAPQTI